VYLTSHNLLIILLCPCWVFPSHASPTQFKRIHLLRFDDLQLLLHNNKLTLIDEIRFIKSTYIISGAVTRRRLTVPRNLDFSYNIIYIYIPRSKKMENISKYIIVIQTHSHDPFRRTTPRPSIMGVDNVRHICTSSRNDSARDWDCQVVTLTSQPVSFMCFYIYVALLILLHRMYHICPW